MQSRERAFSCAPLVRACVAGILKPIRRRCHGKRPRRRGAGDPEGRLPAAAPRPSRTPAQGEAMAAVEQTVSGFGRLNTFVNNAGVMLLGPALESPTDE